MSILAQMNKDRQDFIVKYGIAPQHLTLTSDEGFDLLKEIIPTLTLTYMQRVELKIVLSEKNQLGLRQAFQNATILNCKITIDEGAANGRSRE